MKLTEKDKELVKKAEDVIKKSRRVKLVDTADFGSSLVTSKGNVYSGVSLGHYCGIGSCAENQAIGSMISNGEKNIKTIVAVRYDEKKKGQDIIPPCGKCREMIKQTSKSNLNTDVIISDSEKVKLKELLPHSWRSSISS